MNSVLNKKELAELEELKLVFRHKLSVLIDRATLPLDYANPYTDNLIVDLFGDLLSLHSRITHFDTFAIQRRMDQQGWGGR